MPKGKKATYDMISKKFSEKELRKSKAAKNKNNVPPTVDNYKMKTHVANPRNIGVLQKVRMISPNEGKPTVNAKSVSEAQKLITKTGKIYLINIT